MRRLVPLALLALFALASPARAFTMMASPAPAASPEFRSGNTAPVPVAVPSGLPHYVGLDPLARAQLERLLDELAEAAQLTAAGRLASARVLLARARREADSAQRQLLILKLSPDWTEARLRLDEAQQKLAASWARGSDPESRQLAAAARTRLDTRLAALERDLPRLARDEQARQLRALRQDLLAAGRDPLLDGNPAWKEPVAALEKRLAALEQLATLRAGQAQLLDQIIYMAKLDADARLKLEREDYDGARADLVALEEACLTFKQDLTALVARGFDPRQISFEGEDGGRQGQGFLAKVDRWLLEARRRDQRIAEAQDPWRKALTGDRLRIYGMYGAPTPTLEEALATDLWIYWEPKPGQPKVKLRHEYRFVGDHLQHHELFEVKG